MVTEVMPYVEATADGKFQPILLIHTMSPTGSEAHLVHEPVGAPTDVASAAMRAAMDHVSWLSSTVDV